jgi:hypothetical protein
VVAEIRNNYLHTISQKYPKMDGIHKRKAVISLQPPWLIVFTKSEGEYHKAPVNFSKARLRKLCPMGFDQGSSFEEQTQRNSL